MRQTYVIEESIEAVHVLIFIELEPECRVKKDSEMITIELSDAFHAASFENLTFGCPMVVIRNGEVCLFHRRESDHTLK